MEKVNEILGSGLLEQYVLRLCSPEEARTVERYMVEYPEVKNKVNRLRSCMEHYTGLYDIPSPKKSNSSVPAPTPAKKHKSFSKCLSIESKFGRTPYEEDNHLQEKNPSWWLGIMGIVFLSLASVSYYWMNSKATLSSSAEEKLMSKMKSLEQEVKSKKNLLKEVQQQNHFLKNEHTRKIKLKGLSTQPQAEVIVYYNAYLRASLVQAVQLPQLAPKEQYHIWAKTKDQALNLCALSPSLPSDTLLYLPYTPNVNAFYLSLQTLQDSVLSEDRAIKVAAN